MPTTQSSKNAEKEFPELLRKYNVPAERILRMGNYSISIEDWRITEGPCTFIKGDAKYSKMGFRQNRMHRIVREKYCKNKKDEPVTCFKGYREIGEKIMFDDEFAAMMIAVYGGYLTREQAEEIRYGKVE